MKVVMESIFLVIVRLVWSFAEKMRLVKEQVAVGAMSLVLVEVLICILHLIVRILENCQALLVGENIQNALVLKGLMPDLLGVQNIILLHVLPFVKVLIMIIVKIA